MIELCLYKAKEAFFQMMNDWFTEFVWTNPATRQPPPPPVPQPIPIIIEGTEPIGVSKPLVDKIRNYEAKEFGATVEDDPGKAEFWLENTIRVFDKFILFTSGMS